MTSSFGATTVTGTLYVPVRDRQRSTIARTSSGCTAPPSRVTSTVKIALAVAQVRDFACGQARRRDRNGDRLGKACRRDHGVGRETQIGPSDQRDRERQQLQTLNYCVVAQARGANSPLRCVRRKRRPKRRANRTDAANCPGRRRDARHDATSTLRSRFSSPSSRESRPARAIEIAPVSSEMTRTIASVCSERPMAARCRVPRWSPVKHVLGERQKAAGGFDQRSAHDGRPVVQRRPRREDREQQLGGKFRIQARAAFDEFAQPSRAFDRDERADAVARQDHAPSAPGSRALLRASNPPRVLRAVRTTPRARALRADAATRAERRSVS